MNIKFDEKYLKFWNSMSSHIWHNLSRLHTGFCFATNASYHKRKTKRANFANALFICRKQKHILHTF